MPPDDSPTRYGFRRVLFGYRRSDVEMVLEKAEKQIGWLEHERDTAAAQAEQRAHQATVDRDLRSEATDAQKRAEQQLSQARSDADTQRQQLLTMLESERTRWHDQLQAERRQASDELGRERKRAHDAVQAERTDAEGRVDEDRKAADDRVAFERNRFEERLETERRRSAQAIQAVKLVGESIEEVHKHACLAADTIRQEAAQEAEAIMDDVRELVELRDRVAAEVAKEIEEAETHKGRGGRGRPGHPSLDQTTEAIKGWSTGGDRESAAEEAEEPDEPAQPQASTTPVDSVGDEIARLTARLEGLIEGVDESARQAEESLAPDEPRADDIQASRWDTPSAEDPDPETQPQRSEAGAPTAPAAVTGRGVVLEIGPITTFEELTRCQDAAAGIGAVEQVRIESFSGGRATFVLTVSADVDLPAALGDASSLPLLVRSQDSSRLVLDIASG
ncbi:MAG: hypothetical protein ACR2NA_13450 [Solirubrobacterales bacterium]